MSEDSPSRQLSGPGTFAVQTSADYFEQIVRPTVADYLEDQFSQRHALLAVLVCFHMVDWHRPSGGWGKKGKSFEERFVEVYGQTEVVGHFETARRLANGTKHFEGFDRTTGSLGFDRGFSDDFARLTVALPNGRSISVSHLLTTMMQFWEKQLGQE